MGNSETADPAKAVLAQDYDPQKMEPYYWAYLPQHLAIRGYLEYALDYRLWGNQPSRAFSAGRSGPIRICNLPIILQH
jgi:hypothetical protein